MSGYRRMEIFETSPSLFIRETSFFSSPTLTFSSFSSFPQVDDLGLALDLFTPSTCFSDLSPKCFLSPVPSPCELFEFVTDVIQIDRTPFSSSYKRFHSRTAPDSYLRPLCDRVSALELGIDHLLKEKPSNRDRKYTWTTEIKDAKKDGVDRKYEWTAEIKGGKKGGKLGEVEKNYKWTAEFKGKGKDAQPSRSFTFKASTAPAGDSSESDSDKEKKTKKEKEKKKKSKGEPSIRVVEIEDPVDQGVIVLRQAFAKRVGADAKGKKKELSPQDAAMMIQLTFRAYLIRRSQALRALRDLAVAKSKLKEIRALFNNFPYRRRIARDAEELQRFSEKIIVLLLTVDAIEGADLMFRASRKSMVDELEAMLDVVDPQPPGKLGSMKRRKFDLPDGTIQKEIAAGVAEVVQMLNEDDSDHSAAFEACL